MGRDAITARLVDLRAKLAAREGFPAYGANCAELRAEIEKLEAKLAK